MIVHPPARYQLIVIALFNDSLIRQNQYSVGISYAGKPVGNGKGGAPLRKLCKRFCHLKLAFIVKRRGSLVKNNDLRVLKENPRDAYSLLLPA